MWHLIQGEIEPDVCVVVRVGELLHRDVVLGLECYLGASHPAGSFVVAE